jgi:hypothetical protein
VKRLVLSFLLIGAAQLATPAEFFVGLTDEQRALSRELQRNARQSKKLEALDASSRVSAWFIGTARADPREFHVLAYYTRPTLCHLGIFFEDERLAVLWQFPYDARQFYMEGTKLMFAVRARLHVDTQDSWRQVEREVVVGFAAVPENGEFSFRGGTYRL